jgi:hypothetical protein
MLGGIGFMKKKLKSQIQLRNNSKMDQVKMLKQDDLKAFLNKRLSQEFKQLSPDTMSALINDLTPKLAYFCSLGPSEAMAMARLDLRLHVTDPIAEKYDISKEKLDIIIDEVLRNFAFKL